MAKKFGKILLFISAVGAAFAGAFYIMKSKKSSPAEEDDDYEDLDDDSYEVSDDEASGERSYVSLNSDKESSGGDAPKTENDTDAKVEEFFDDDDSDGSLDAI